MTTTLGPSINNVTFEYIVTPDVNVHKSMTRGWSKNVIKSVTRCMNGPFAFKPHRHAFKSIRKYSIQSDNFLTFAFSLSTKNPAI